MLSEKQLRGIGLDHNSCEEYFAAMVVAGGAVVLDHKFPKWFTKIDLGSFDLGSSEKGVLSQIFESDGTGLSQLGITDRMKYELGFDCDQRTHTVMLTAAWKREIEQRRSQAFLHWVKNGSTE
jgi:hypothetical protein